MRKIESAMLAAIRDGRSWRDSNTAVTAYENIGGLDSLNVTLHGNLIAEVTRRNVRVTLAGWNTPTTRSRVNAILREFASGHPRVSTKDGIPRLRTSASAALRMIDSREWITVPRAGVSS